VKSALHDPSGSQQQ